MYHFSFGQEPSVNREKDWRLSSPKVFNEIYRTRSETIHDFDVLHYKFDLTFPMISSAFSGIVTLTCQSGIGELHEV